MALSPFGVSLVAGFNNAAIWIRIWIIVSMAGFAVLAGFGCQRVSVYFMRDAAGYFSRHYTTPPNSINDVIPHVACGFATFLMVPVLVITYIVAGLAPLRLPACLLFLGVAVATVGTIAGIPSQLSALAGVGVVILAGLWAVWWGITGVMSAVYAFKKNQERFQEWFFRCWGMAAYGFLLLPILKALQTQFALDAVLLALLLLYVIGFSEVVIRAVLRPGRKSIVE